MENQDQDSHCSEDNYGKMYYSNKTGHMHRIGGPAIISKNGYVAWMINGIVVDSNTDAILELTTTKGLLKYLKELKEYRKLK